MKKISIILLAIWSLTAIAGDYDYLNFITADGTQQIVAANLVMTINSSSLTADNGSKSLTIELAKLQQMYFSDENGVFTDLEKTEYDADTNVSVFTIDGKSLGQYSNITEAVRSLSQGTYIVRRNNNSIKILVP